MDNINPSAFCLGVRQKQALCTRLERKKRSYCIACETSIRAAPDLNDIVRYVTDAILPDIMPDDNVAFVDFADAAYGIVPMSPLKTVKKYIRGWLPQMMPCGSVDMAECFRKAAEQFMDQSCRNTIKILFLISNGPIGSERGLVYRLAKELLSDVVILPIAFGFPLEQDIEWFCSIAHRTVLEEPVIYHVSDGMPRCVHFYERHVYAEHTGIFVKYGV